MPPGIRNGVEAAAEEHLSAGVKSLEIKSVVVQKLPSFRIGRDEDLEAAVEGEAVDEIGADAATDAVGGFEEEERDVLGLEVGRGGQAG